MNDPLFSFFIRLYHFVLQEKAKAEPKKPEQPEVTVLNTLRILSAMETLLGQEQGYKTNILLAQAKSLEATPPCSGLSWPRTNKKFSSDLARLVSHQPRPGGYLEADLTEDRESGGR